MKKYIVYIMIMVFLIPNIISAYSIVFSRGIEDRPAYVICYYDFASETFNAIEDACDEWNTYIWLSAVIKSSNTHTTTNYPIDDGNNYISKGYRGIYSYLAETTVYPDSLDYDAIESADIDLNVSFSYSNNGSPYDYNVQNVITHELGHLLGLNDQYSSFYEETTMYGYIDPGETKKSTLEDDDIDGLEAIYN